MKYGSILEQGQFEEENKTKKEKEILHECILNMNRKRKEKWEGTRKKFYEKEGISVGEVRREER